MRRLILVTILGLLTGTLAFLHGQQLSYTVLGSVNVAPTAPLFTAVDPLAYGVPSQNDVIPPRPFLYSVDKNGITITRFNDNKVVGTWPWPQAIWITKPDGSITEIPAPAGGWEPVGMTVSYPTALEFGNRVKEIPDLTPPFTYVYVVMAHSGYEWRSNPNAALLQDPNVRDTIVPSTDPAKESSMLVQIDVSDPSFSASRDPVAPVTPHIAGAILGHGAGQPVYDRKTANVYVGNMPSGSLPAGLTSFVSAIRRIPDTVAASEAEIPGLSKPVIRCGPQHPQNGIPVGKPQAFACYDPSGTHSIDDNEHVGAYGHYVWEFKDLPPWLTAHKDKVTGELDGILYGTPTTTGEWFAQVRVHNLDDEYGIFSDWTTIWLLVTPTAEYLPIKSQFAVGEPAAYPLEGTGSCALSGAPAWMDFASVPNGCVVMGKAAISGEHYQFTMDLTLTAYPTTPVVFSGNVVGSYNFVPLPEGVGLSGLAWHQVEMYPDPSTEPAVLSLEYIGVQPSTGQLYQILPPPGKPQPPNERPPETAIVVDTVSTMGSPLPAPLNLVRFGEVAVEADRDIFVAAVTNSADGGALIKVSGGAVSTINLPGVQPYYLDLDSDLRPAIIGVDPGQVDHGVLWVTGSTTANVAVVDTALGTVAQTLSVSGASSLGSVSVDFGMRYAYVAGGSSGTVTFFGPAGTVRPPMRPRIWSTEEVTFNRGFAAPVPIQLMATGDPVPTLSLLGTLPDGLSFADNGDGTASLSGTPGPTTEGDYAFTLTATSTTGTYAQAFGITVETPPAITSGDTATFAVGSASSFTVTGTGYPTPIFFTWDEAALPPGVQLVDNENGTASLVGIPETAGTYVFTINATTGCPPDAAQTFTLTVDPAGPKAPTITSPNTTTWEIIGAPFPPDPFTVTSTGSPTPALSVAPGMLPPGVTFLDNGNSTATIGGMPLSAGTYTFTITASNTAGSATQTFNLIVETCTSIIGAAPANLAFAYTVGGSMPAPQTVSVTTLGDTLPYAVVTTANWLSATPISGTIPRPLSVSVNPSGLAAGTHTGSVIVTSAGTEGPFATVMVSLAVVGGAIPPGMPTTMNVTPSTLSFQYIVLDGTKPPAQTLSVKTGGAALKYTVSSGGASWLSATPATGTTPDAVTVSVDPTRMGIGTTLGTLTITSADSTTAPLTVQVSVTKAVTTDTLYSPDVNVLFNVGAAPEGIALNPKTHDLFITSANEAASEANEDATAVEVPEPVDLSEGDAVFHLNPSNGTVAQIMVHSEGEYAAVNGKTGIVYHASQRTGEIAVIDGAKNTVVTFIPLVYEGGAYMPYQIAIDEAQNLIYVGAKAPPIPDPEHVAPFPCKAIHEMPDDEYDCWNPGRVFVIDGKTNQLVLGTDGKPMSFLAGDDPEGLVFAALTGKLYASNEDDGSITVAQGAKRNKDGTITAPVVLRTIIKGEPVAGWWQPTCDANNYCGERGQAALWPTQSACNGIDDEAEEADKMTVDPLGNVYIIDDRYRVAKINGWTDRVINVLEIPGYACEEDVPDGSDVLFANTANNIAFMPLVGRDGRTAGTGVLYVTSEQNTITLIDASNMTIKTVLTLPGAAELDAITTDPALGRVYVTDEGQAALWILKGNCAGGVPTACIAK